MPSHHRERDLELDASADDRLRDRYEDLKLLRVTQPEREAQAEAEAQAQKKSDSRCCCKPSKGSFRDSSARSTPDSSARSTSVET